MTDTYETDGIPRTQAEREDKAKAMQKALDDFVKQTEGFLLDNDGPHALTDVKISGNLEEE